MTFDPDICRSLLFVPAGNERYLASALRGGADVIQVDLEDAVTPDRKAEARSEAAKAVARIASAGRIAAVRVNTDDELLQTDLDAVIVEGLSAITVPKVETASDLLDVAARITRLEADRGLPSGEIRLIAQIESASGVLNARDIAGSTPRLAAMGIGMEDLAADVGGRVTEDALYFPNMQVLYAAREAGVVPIGYPGSITEYRDTKTFRGWVGRTRDLGFEGGFCIHPNQVEVLNDTLAPSADEVVEAEALVAAFDQHAEEGLGAFAYEGRMVDRPVVERARRAIGRARKLGRS